MDLVLPLEVGAQEIDQGKILDAEEYLLALAPSAVERLNNDDETVGS